MSDAWWQDLVGEARGDESVIGLVLTGGRGKGVWTAQSDWDGLLVVADPAVDRWRARDPGSLDLTVIGATDFETYAEPFTPFAWRGYDFARLSADVDRGGFQAALDRKGRLGPDASIVIAEEAVGVSLNQLYRGAKSARDGASDAARLDLIESLSATLTALFALEGRHRPYNKLLTWDLRQEPLRVIPSGALLADIDAVATTADLGAAWRLEAAIERSATTAGATETLSSWLDHLADVRPAAPS